MTLPTVIEITPQPEAVTRDTFIDGLTAPARAAGERDLTTGRGVTRLDGHGRLAAVRAPVSGGRVARSPASFVATTSATAVNRRSARRRQKAGTAR